MSTGNRAATAQRITADAAVGTSGNAVLVEAVSLGAGTTNSNLALRNGTDATGAILWQVNSLSAVAADTTSQTMVFPKPIVFPLGCFADITGTNAVAYVAYEPA